MILHGLLFVNHYPHHYNLHHVYASHYVVFQALHEVFDYWDNPHTKFSNN